MSQRDRGFVLPTTALLLIPLMIFAALAIDFGAWSVQATRMQNGADAAALAGAPYLPNTEAALRVATETAAANGHTNDVVVSFPDPLTIEVDITEPSATFFSAVALDPFPINRVARATALSPITMGSPTNVLGHGPHDLGPGIGASGYFTIFGNGCSYGHYGDIGAPQFNAATQCGNQNGPNPQWRNLNGSTIERRSTGHFLVIEVPPGVGASSLWIFDPGICGQWNNSGEVQKVGDSNTALSWQLWDDNDTLVNLTDDYPVGAPWSSDDCAKQVERAETGSATHADWTKGWTQTSFNFPANYSGATERYLLEPRAVMAPGATRFGWNYHSYWIRPNGTNSACSTVTNLSCPTIGAESWLVAGASGPEAPAGEQANSINRSMDLYLAEVGPEHQGKNLEVLLFDTGEGMDNIQLLDPLGKPLDFTWSSNHRLDTSPVNNPATCAAGPDRPTWPAAYQGQQVPCLSVFERRPPRFASWPNTMWRFDGTIVRVSIPLTVENGIDLASYPNHWFTLRFMPRAGERLREWASFSVQVSGDPIRLVQ